MTERFRELVDNSGWQERDLRLRVAGLEGSEDFLHILEKEQKQKYKRAKEQCCIGTFPFFKNNHNASFLLPSFLPSFLEPMPEAKNRMMLRYARVDHAIGLAALLRNHSDVDVNWADDQDQQAALHLASIFGHPDVLEVLLAHPGVNVNQRNSFGCTPFSIGCER